MPRVRTPEYIAPEVILRRLQEARDQGQAFHPGRVFGCALLRDSEELWQVISRIVTSAYSVGTEIQIHRYDFYTSICEA